MRIVVLAAFSDEITHISQQVADLKEIMISKCRCWKGSVDNHEIILSLTGIGTNASAITTTLLCEKLNPDLIIFCGVAGGLGSGQQIGDLVLASKIIDADLLQLPEILRDTPYKNALVDPHSQTPMISEYAVHDSISNTLASFSFERLKPGIVATSNTFPAPKNLFSQIKRLGCSAIEMESTGIVKAAAAYDVPVIILRAISNLLDEDGNDLGTHPEALTICSQRLAACLNEMLAHHSMSNITMLSALKQQQRIAELVNKYRLTQHPEGGWFCQTFKSTDSVKGEGAVLTRYQGEPRSAGTSIIYLLGESDFSAWHTVQSDETWSFHQGDPLLLRIINPNSGKLQEIILGLDSANLQFTVKAGHVFSAESRGKISVVGCVVTPGFDFKDFKLLSKKEFLDNYPTHAELVYLIREKPYALDTLKTKFFDNVGQDALIVATQTETQGLT